MTGKKREKPLGLDMDFGEALERFVGVDPNDLPDEIKLGPQKKGDGEPPPSKVTPKARDKGG